MRLPHSPPPKHSRSWRQCERTCVFAVYLPQLGKHPPWNDVGPLRQHKREVWYAERKMAVCVRPQQQNFRLLPLSFSFLPPTPPPPLPRAVVFNLFMLPRVSQSEASGRLCRLPDLENRKSAASCLSPPNFKFKLVSRLLAPRSGSLDPSEDNRLDW